MSDADGVTITVRATPSSTLEHIPARPRPSHRQNAHRAALVASKGRLGISCGVAAQGRSKAVLRPPRGALDFEGLVPVVGWCDQPFASIPETTSGLATGHAHHQTTGNIMAIP